MARTKQYTRTDALHKATQLFWLKGYTATSMQDLVDGLEMSRASIYAEFGDKQGLFEASLQHYFDENMSGAYQLLESQQSGYALIQQFFTQAIEAGKNPNCTGCFVANTVAELLPEQQHLQPALLFTKRGMTALFERFLEKGRADGSIDAKINNKHLAEFCYNLLTGIRISTKMEQDPSAILASTNATLAQLLLPAAH